METAENTGLTTSEPKLMFEERMVTVRDTLSELASSDDWEDGEDQDDAKTQQRKLSEYDEPSQVKSTISQTVQQCMEMFKPKQMMLEKLTQLGWGDTAHYFCERDKKHGTSELRIQAVVKLQMDDNAAPPASTTLGELMECLHSVPGISQMPQETS